MSGQDLDRVEPPLMVFCLAKSLLVILRYLFLVVVTPVDFRQLVLMVEANENSPFRQKLYVENLILNFLEELIIRRFSRLKISQDC